MLRIGNAIVIVGGAVIAVACIKLDALTPVIEFAAQTTRVDGALRLLQCAHIVNRVPSLRSEIGIFEFEFTTTADRCVAIKNLPWILNQGSHGLTVRFLGADADHLYPADREAFAGGIVALSSTQVIEPFN